MKNYLFLFIFFLIINCASREGVYWCGDHPCINKKEKEAYFKKNMIVEVKNLKKNTYKDKSSIEKLLKQSQMNEKNIIKNEKELAKQAKLEEKRRIKNEKELAKQAKLEEKRRIKNEKELDKQIKLEEKRIIKGKKIESDKKIVKNEKKIIEKDVEIESVKINLSKFSDLVEKITKRNSLKPYPEINDIPN